MRVLPVYFLILGAPFACANEALDVLEGKIDANSVVLPPPPFKEGAVEEEEVGELIYLEPEWAASPLDSIWSRSVLYDSAANPWVQEVAITGLGPELCAAFHRLMEGSASCDKGCGGK